MSKKVHIGFVSFSLCFLLKFLFYFFFSFHAENAKGSVALQDKSGLDRALVSREFGGHLSVQGLIGGLTYDDCFFTVLRSRLIADDSGIYIYIDYQQTQFLMVLNLGYV